MNPLNSPKRAKPHFSLHVSVSSWAALLAAGVLLVLDDALNQLALRANRMVSWSLCKRKGLLETANNLLQWSQETREGDQA